MPGEPGVTQHCSARSLEQGSQLVLHLPWSLCHLVKEHWEDGGVVGSCTDAGTHGEQTAGLDHWLLVDSLCLQLLRQLGRVVGEAVPCGISGGMWDFDEPVLEAVLPPGSHPSSLRSHQHSGVVHGVCRSSHVCTGADQLRNDSLLQGLHLGRSHWLLLHPSLLPPHQIPRSRRRLRCAGISVGCSS